MSLCPGHDSNVARGGDKANMYSLPTGIHENLVARPLNSPAKRDEKNLGDLGCFSPTVMITRTRSVCGGTPSTGIVDSRAIHRVEADVVQGVTLVLQPVDVGTSNKTIDAKEKNSIRYKAKYARRKKREFVYLEKTKKFEPVSQIDLLQKDNVDNSENNTTSEKARVCKNSDRSNSICTHITGSVIEELNNNPVDNPYFVTKSQEDLNKQRAFAMRLYRKRKKKEKEETPKKRKNKLTETELKERKKKRDAERYEKRKKELKNNMTLNSFIIKPTVVTNPSSIVRTCNEPGPSSNVRTCNEPGTTEVSANNITVTAEITPEKNTIQARTPSCTN